MEKTSEKKIGSRIVNRRNNKTGNYKCNNKRTIIEDK